MINLNNEFPNNSTTPNAMFPYGGARDVVTPGDNTGTPFKANLYNDILGLQQFLVNEANIIPNGSSDNAVESQQFNALWDIMNERTLTHNISSDSDFTLSDSDNLKKRIVITDTTPILTTNRNIIVDKVQKSFIVRNETTQYLTIKTIDGSGIKVYPNEEKELYCDGINVVFLKLNNNVNSNGSVSFVFDDGYASAYNAIAPLFNSYGLKCGFSIYTSGVDSVGKITKGQLLDLYENGFEIINHAYDGTPLPNAVGKQFVKAQIETAMSYFEEIGIKCNCWQTPSSVLGSNFYELFKNKFTFAFTKTAPNRPILNDNSSELFRHSLESITLEDCKTLIQKALVDGGSVIFYAHDAIVGSDIYNLTNTLINYCNTLGVPIKTPSESLKDGVIQYKEKDYYINKGNIVLDSKGNYTTSFGTLTINANKEVVVSSAGSGLATIQNGTLTNNFIDADGGEMIYSTGIRCISGTFGINSAIGIKLTDITTGATLYQLEETIPTIGNSYLRFNVKAPNIGKCKILIYVKADFTSAGEIRLNAPILRMGNSVTAPDAKRETSTLYSLTIPAQTITAGSYSTSNNITLTDQADNGLFEIVSGVLKFTRTAKVSITASVSAYGTGVLTGSKGGGLFAKVGNTGLVNAFSSPLSVGSDCGGGSLSFVMTVCNYNNLILSLFNIGCNFPINTTFSRLTIVEILD